MAGGRGVRVLRDDRSKVPDLIHGGLSRPLKEMAKEAQGRAEAFAPISDRPGTPRKPKYALSFGHTQGSPKVIGALVLPGFPQGATIRVTPAGTYNFAPHAPWVEFATGRWGSEGQSYPITARRSADGNLWIPIDTMRGAPPDPRNPKVKRGAGGRMYYVTKQVMHPGSKGQYILTTAAVESIDDDVIKFRQGLRDAAEDLNLEVEESTGGPSETVRKLA